MVFFETGKTKNPVGEWCFEVTGVAHGALSYDPGANHVTQSCESGDIYTVDGAETGGVLAYGLGKNYPDPFNPVTVISFNLPEASTARLTVYNVQGQLVETLADGAFSAGEHRVRWDASAAPSGVYFYHLETRDFSATQKMVLIK